MKTYRYSLIRASIALSLMGLIVAGAQAAQQVSSTFDMPTQLQGRVTALECSNSPGPQVTLEGVLALGGLGVELIFRNNINKDVHTNEEEFRTVATVIQPGESIVIPKQPVLGGTGGNPFIWIQLLDNNDKALSGEVYLGRCVQGLFQPQADFFNLVAAMARVAVLDCTNNPGPNINLDGDLSFARGIKARFIFRNNDNPVSGPHEADVVRDVVIVATGTSLSFPKQPVQGGAGGNPWISVQFKDAQNKPLGNEVLLGRCVQLLPGN